MTVLRVYLPAECDVDGFPLDLEKCRACDGCGKLAIDGDGPFTCPKCEGHGSLREAALDHLHMTRHGANRDEWLRCEDCQHPVSEGTWESHRAGLVVGPKIAARILRDVWRELVDGREPHPAMGGMWGATHFSRCDEKCQHKGPGRTHDPIDRWCATPEIHPCKPRPEWVVEASWRPVDVRCLSWPHDLRPEQLAVLCLRCWAARKAAG